MRPSLPALALSLMLSLPAAAQDPGIESTIRGQIAAFLKDDFATAFTYASPTIRGLFGTPENFGAMVRQGYPMVHRPAEVELLDLREVAGALWQRVRITDAAGGVHLLDYQMVPGPEGWQINAVQILRAPGVGV
ncbi:MAG: DUF4864 domain-containing protein [Rhodobacterales bacterium]|nr:DUF4864 domain-containing protein [Rhodobacterales bacterium]